MRRRGSNEMGVIPMRHAVVRAACLLAMCAATATSASAEGFFDMWSRLLNGGTAQPQAQPAHIEEKRTRFRIALSKHVKFQVFSLSQPNRVVVELPNVGLKLPPPVNGAPVGLVKAFRGGKSAPGRARIVIEVTEPVVVDQARITPAGASQELVLDIIPVGGAGQPIQTAAVTPRRPIPPPTYNLGAGRLQPPVPAPARRLSEIRANAYKPVIVIDPGHGGHDSGAKKNGVVEKEVVLAFGKKLRDQLEATGRYKVIMTRDSDVFIKLSERVAFAERHKASLFMAIHADYASSSASGATVYSLRDSLANGLRRRTQRKSSSTVLTRKEMAKVKKARGNVSVVKGFLSDLAKREVDATRDRTKLFSKSIVNYMGRSTTMRRKPHKSAGFRVLKTQKFPSVLIELAYVTNKNDAQKLKSDAWRNQVANSLTKAVDDYFNQQIAAFPM